MLDLELLDLFPKLYNPNLHNIARSDRIGFKIKNLHIANFILAVLLERNLTNEVYKI